MDIIFDLVRRLVLLTIFASFCELLLPKGSFRSYTRMVVGLLVIAMLLQPVLELKGSTLDLEGILGIANLTAGSPELQAGTWVKEQSQELVEAELAELVESFMASDYPGYKAEVALDLGFDQKGSLTEFRKMTVNLRPQAQGVAPIRPVSVGGEEPPDSRQPAAPETASALAHHLGIPAAILSIWVYTGGGETDGR